MKKNIQIITNKKEIDHPKNMIMSKLNNPKSLDEFKINIFDLNDENIWINNEGHTRFINSFKDLENNSTMIQNSNNTTNVIILPQNFEMRYTYYPRVGSKAGYYKNSIELKNMINNLVILINFLFPIGNFGLDLTFENTKTKINDKEIKAAFYFNYKIEGRVLTESMLSDKTTTLKITNKVILTTLDLDSGNKINCFLKHINLLKEESKAPAWIKDISILDDIKEVENIDKLKNKIELLEHDIEESTNILIENSKYKSILYESGKQLELIILEMLGDMLNYNFESFEDLYDEDFLIILDDITFIGEIKGESRNVKKEHVSQLDSHFQKYIDKLEEANEPTENIKSILVINYQRNIKPSKRLEVPKGQIKLAERNNSLIIDSQTFLNLYEKFRNNEVTSEQIQEMITNSTGLLKIND